MSLLQETTKVLIRKQAGIVSFINEQGHSTEVLYIRKPHTVKDEDFKEIMQSLHIKFKKKS